MVSNNSLKLLRERKGWSQARLAREMEAPDKGTIGRWERGRHIPSGYYQEKLAQCLNVGREELGFIIKKQRVKHEEVSFSPHRLIAIKEHA